MRRKKAAPPAQPPARRKLEKAAIDQLRTLTERLAHALTAARANPHDFQAERDLAWAKLSFMSVAFCEMDRLLDAAEMGRSVADLDESRNYRNLLSAAFRLTTVGEHEHAEHAHQAAADLLSLAAKVAELQRFKSYVHERLDKAGIEKEPKGKHSKEGCRIGDRLDILLAGYERPAAAMPRKRGAKAEPVPRAQLPTKSVINQLRAYLAEHQANPSLKLNVFIGQELIRRSAGLLAAAEMAEEIGWLLPSMRAYLCQTIKAAEANPDATESAKQIARAWLERADAFLQKYFDIKPEEKAK